MWHTSSGDRVLTGAEAQLLKFAVSGMVELIKEETSDFGEHWEYGIRLFDELMPSQRLSLLEHVTTCLLDESCPMPELTAVNEAAIGAIFAHLEAELDWEIDGLSSGSPLRELLLRAYSETSGPMDPSEDDEWSPPDTDAVDTTEWGFVIESLADEILWDRDYELIDPILDAPPEKAHSLKVFMGIDPDYFSMPSPDVRSDEEPQKVLARLESLCAADETPG